MKLSKYVESKQTVLSVSNVDDIFADLVSLGIEKVSVFPWEMRLICMWYLANVGNDKNGEQGKVIREGKIDKFFGIDLGVIN